MRGYTVGFEHKTCRVNPKKGNTFSLFGKKHHWARALCSCYIEFASSIYLVGENFRGFASNKKNRATEIRLYKRVTVPRFSPLSSPPSSLLPPPSSFPTSTYTPNPFSARGNEPLASTRREKNTCIKARAWTAHHRADDIRRELLLSKPNDGVASNEEREKKVAGIGKFSQQ